MIVFACHPAANRLSLRPPFQALLSVQGNTNINNNYMRGDIMAENSKQDYFEENSEGHVDTREANFKCENPDEHLGCDPGIDVAG